MQDPSTPFADCRLEELPLAGGAISALLESLVCRRSDPLVAATERDPVLAARILADSGAKGAGRDPGGLQILLGNFSPAKLSAFVSATLSAANEAGRTTPPPSNGSATSFRLFECLRRYACCVASLARDNAARRGSVDPEAMYLAGLLESLGMFVLAHRFPGAYFELLSESSSPPEAKRRERAQFGTDSAVLRRRLARLWGLPQWIVASKRMLPGGAYLTRASAECWPVVETSDLKSSIPPAIEPDSALDYRVTPETVRELVRFVSDHDRHQAAHREQLEREKLESLAEFAAGAGHEINNPLAVIYGRAQLLLGKETDPERRRALLTMGTQAMRIHEMIADLMLFARPPEPQREQVDLVPLVTEAFASLAARADQQGVTLRFQPPKAPVEAWADPIQVRVVLVNLITNSLEALAKGGTIEVMIRRRSAASTLPSNNGQNGQKGTLLLTPNGDSPAEFTVLRITDDGSGMTDEVRRHLFDPFYSGRQAGRGMGLGLSKCWRIVQAHGGSIEVKSRPGRGTTFTVLLPTLPEAETMPSLQSLLKN